MSRLRTLAFAIKERVEEIPALENRVVVFRRADIESELEQRLAKARGRCVVIRLFSGKNESPKAGKPRFRGTFTVSLFSAPLLSQKEATDVDELMEQIVRKLHGWWPGSVPSNGAIRIEALSISYPDADAYDVSVLTIEAP